MASTSSSSNKNSVKNSANEKKRAFSSPNTTVIRTDPSNFKSVVHEFTGLHRQDRLTSPHPLPASAANAPLPPPTSGDLGPRMPVFKLHERRRPLQGGRKLEEIMLSQTGDLAGGERVVISPVSPFDLLGLGGSPRRSATPTSRPAAPVKAETEEQMDEELRGIKANGFYLHPSTLAMMAIGYKPQPLMPLLPVDEEGGGDVDNGESSS